jgi:hypothetical protein
MAKKIKRSKIEGVYKDPNLEEVGEERAFEIELDDETNEVIFVNHYRQKWGDGFDADIEHGFNIVEAEQIVIVIMQMIKYLKEKNIATVAEKVTINPTEGNPLQNNNKIEE